MSDPSVQPIYVTSLEEIWWGGTLVVITMILHGFGMIAVLRVNEFARHWCAKKTGFVTDMFPVILATVMIMLVHLTEVFVWAVFFLWKGAFVNSSLAYYFSLNEYTTVGSDFSLPVRWRLLEGMIATAGLLAFAWSTGILVTLAQGFQEQRLQRIHQRRQRERSSLRLTEDKP